MPRDDVLAVLTGQSIARMPAFTVLPGITAPGLQSMDARYSDVHTDANKMARAAASSFRLFEVASAVVPFDLCVEAEALECGIDFQTDIEAFLAPVVIAPLPLTHSIDFKIDLEKAGRIPLVGQAIRLLKQDVGNDIAIGAWVPGPFTLAWQVFGMDGWLTVLRDELRVKIILESFADFLARIGNYYRTAGADFLTVHEMGGTAQVVGANRFRELVQPALVRLFAQIPSPNVLSICGDTSAIVREMAACGASALHFDQKNDMARTRQILGRDAILLGNLDPMHVLSFGTPELIRQKVSEARNAGVNAVLPGCDVYPDISSENVRAWVDAAKADE